MRLFVYSGLERVSPKCRTCDWNNYRQCGVDFCGRAKCIYAEELKGQQRERENKC